VEGLHALLLALLALDTRHPDYAQILTEWNDVSEKVNSEFPERKSLILPTQLGNIIRSFERYPDIQYGIESITIWPRLIAVLDAEYAALDAAKTSLSFMLNSSMLSGGLSLVVLLLGLTYRPSAILLPTLLPALVLMLLARWFYSLSIRHAAQWGGLVKGAFDLYRWDLLRQLGYQHVPRSREQERETWSKIWQQIVFGDRQVGHGRRQIRIDYEPTYVRATPGDLRLEVTRGIKAPSTDGVSTVVVKVKNVDTRSRLATNVIVNDVLPDNLDYEWGSAQVVGREVHVMGTNPYDFYIDGNLAIQDEVILTYRVINNAPR
jgi:uncharacterized repeat protein (TIGR01451 family)